MTVEKRSKIILQDNLEDWFSWSWSHDGLICGVRREPGLKTIGLASCFGPGCAVLNQHFFTLLIIGSLTSGILATFRIVEWIRAWDVNLSPFLVPSYSVRRYSLLKSCWYRSIQCHLEASPVAKFTLRLYLVRRMGCSSGVHSRLIIAGIRRHNRITNELPNLHWFRAAEHISCKLSMLT